MVTLPASREELESSREKALKCVARRVALEAPLFPDITFKSVTRRAAFAEALLVSDFNEPKANKELLRTGRPGAAALVATGMSRADGYRCILSFCSLLDLCWNGLWHANQKLQSN